VALLKFQTAHKSMHLTSSSSRKKEPSYLCLSETKTSHSQRMWSEVSSFAPHFLHKGLSSSPSRWRCILRVLCPDRYIVTDDSKDFSLLIETFKLYKKRFLLLQNFSKI